MDRPGQRDRARPDDARGRDAGQGRATERAGSRPGHARAVRRPARPRRRRIRARLQARSPATGERRHDHPGSPALRLVAGRARLGDHRARARDALGRRGTGHGRPRRPPAGPDARAHGAARARRRWPGSWRSPSTARRCSATRGCGPGWRGRAAGAAIADRPAFIGARDRSRRATSPRCSASRSTPAAGSARDGGGSLHRVTVLAYALGVAHAVGAGTDASTPWLRTFMLATGAPILALFLRRVIGRRPVRAARPREGRAS